MSGSLFGCVVHLITTESKVCILTTSGLSSIELHARYVAYTDRVDRDRVRISIWHWKVASCMFNPDCVAMLPQWSVTSPRIGKYLVFSSVYLGSGAKPPNM